MPPHHSVRLSRRMALGLGAASGLAVLRPRRARAAQPVSFTLPWVPEGANMIAYVAKENGYWADAGLDVAISRGSGSVTAAQAIGAGRFDFGLSVASAGLQQAAKDLPIVQIACCSYDAMMSVAVRRDGPVHTPKDLEGRKLASTTSSGEYPFLPAYAAAAGIDYAKVERVSVDANIRSSILVQGKVDAVSGLAPTLVPTLDALGLPTRIMLYSQAGLRFYGNMLMTQQARLQSDPNTVRGIAAGLMRAARFVLLEPDAALKLFVKVVPEIALAAKGVEQTRLGIGLFQVAMLDESARGKPLGFIDPATFGTMGELVMRNLAAPGDTAPQHAMSNDFLDTPGLTAAEWDRAEASAAEFRALLA